MQLQQCSFVDIPADAHEILPLSMPGLCLRVQLQNIQPSKFMCIDDETRKISRNQRKFHTPNSLTIPDSEAKLKKKI